MSCNKALTVIWFWRVCLFYFRFYFVGVVFYGFPKKQTRSLGLHVEMVRRSTCRGEKSIYISRNNGVFKWIQNSYLTGKPSFTHTKSVNVYCILTNRQSPSIRKGTKMEVLVFQTVASGDKGAAAWGRTGAWLCVPWSWISELKKDVTQM